MTDTKTISYYDASVDAYIDMVSRETPDADLQSFIDTVPADGTVLDLGCGPGNSAAMMQAAGLIAYATDASGEMVRAARERFQVNATQARFDELDAVAKYDGIWANFSLLHAPRAEMPANLNRIHKALKAGGYLHLGLKIGDGEKRDKLGRNYTYYQPEELKTLLIAANFKPNMDRPVRIDKTMSMSGTHDPFMIVTAYA
jgi:SAM-dependent methyltransferase